MTQVIQCAVKSLGEMLMKHSYREGEFTLTSGRKSDFYINGKKTFLDAEGLYLTSKCFLNIIRTSEVDITAVAGVPLGAAPLVAGISLLSFMEGAGVALPQILIRKEKKDHGAGDQLEVAGTVKSGATVALVDDVMTTGGTLVRPGIEALERKGFHVGLIIVIVEREEGGLEFLASQGFDNVKSIFTKTQLLATK
jgi:orotate phosphoribosyltransferase